MKVRYKYISGFSLAFAVIMAVVNVFVSDFNIDPTETPQGKSDVVKCEIDIENSD